MQNIKDIIANPPEELITEIAKEVCTNRMGDGELGDIITANCSRKDTRGMVDTLWNGKEEVDESQRYMYTRDARTALSVLLAYLEGDKNER
jgi:hypothetical protein